MRADTQNRRYFAASNSSTGFVNYFPRIFGEGRCRRLFVIKGGPGTGKSSFMKHIGSMAEEKGHTVTYYLCSSDPESLDGLFIEELSVGFVDGTAPHVWEPASVGAFEQIVNLGDFWNGDRLMERRPEIEEISGKKKAGYGRAYRYLSAYGALLSAAQESVLTFVDKEKLSRAAERLLLRYAPPAATRFLEEVGLCDSIGMGGRVRLDTYERFAKRRCPIQDLGGTAHLFLAALYALCRERCISVRVSYHPILSRQIDALELIDNGVVFSSAEREEEDRVIHMRRFVDADGYRGVRGNLRESAALGERLLTLAEGAFTEIRACHFQLERLFGDTMDFSAKEQFEARFAESLFTLSP